MGLLIGLKHWDHGKVQGHAPAEIECDPRTIRTGGVEKDNARIHAAALVAQMGEPFKRELKRGVAMNEISQAVMHELQGYPDPDVEGGLCGRFTLTLIGQAATAAAAGVSGGAESVARTGGTQISENAGRNKRGLMHAINRHKFLRHTNPQT